MSSSAEVLRELGDEYFKIQHESDPFNATLLGVSGFDDLVPDVSRAGSAATVARFKDVERRLDEIDVAGLSEAEQVDHAVFGRLTWGARSDLEHGVWETNASAAGYTNPQSLVFQATPTAPLTDPAAVAGYLRRLGGLAGVFEAMGQRYSEAAAEGRTPTTVGVDQAVTQLSGYLALDVADDALLGVTLPDSVDHDAIKAQAGQIIADEVRPAMRRLLARLTDELRPIARGDAEVGLRSVPGGEAAYRAAVRRHTTTDLTPEEIHQIGLDCVADLQSEWAELGAKVLGTSDVPEILRRLREDPALRFSDTGQIVAAVEDALRRAEEARNDWFPAYEIADCVIEEINPIEAGNAALAYYRPPAGDGSRPGAHCVLTAEPTKRFVYEYEALAFHESTPGHHLQIATAQSLTDLPTYRRFLDAEACGFIEGWGLYSERLADDMGLYTSDTARLGMLSFDALRACRLVVDTGMHHLGWSRQQALDYMWQNTATTRENVTNEIDRYIAWPGQALAYMVGRREITRLRRESQQRLGSRFDIRAFHGTVLGNGALPLGVLEQVVGRWADTVEES